MEKISRNNRHKFQEYKDKDGNIYHLEEKIDRGSEGAVYTVKENPNLAAKIYLNTYYKNTQLEKVSAMCNIYDEDIAKYCAMPKSLLYDSCSNLVGYLMENLVGYVMLFDISKMNLSYIDLVHVALNIAKIFDDLYSRNIIICDINTKNILIGKNDVKLIDCESFQFEYNNKTYLCNKGIIRSIPPELSNCKAYKVYRTLNSSLFGLATLMFFILTFGRNPYIKPKDSFIISEFFKYNYRYKDIQDNIMKLIFKNLSAEIVKLFETAFDNDGSNNRPTAKEWINALENYKKSLLACDISNRHQYNSKLEKCVWCELEKLDFRIFA